MSQAEHIKKVREALAEPFPESDIEWRIQRAGEKNGKIWAMCLAYVTNRAIMERLDNVLGIDGWQNEFKPLEGGGNLCGISIKFGDEWVTKWDGAENTAVEAVKGGISGAMKRAAVQWGIGRYLYKLDVGFAINIGKGKLKGQYKDRDKKTVFFDYDSPILPERALPKGEKPKDRPRPEPRPKIAPKTNPKRDAMINEHLNKAENMQELLSLWEELTADEKQEYASLKDKRKAELSLPKECTKNPETCEPAYFVDEDDKTVVRCRAITDEPLCAFDKTGGNNGK